ncbi:MAG: GntR family transcriptional regulator [Acidimicrobiales bacterium]|nr:MAG: GntR family transcriptional regulator [Acidimicrobiales bacterium]
MCRVSPTTTTTATTVASPPDTNIPMTRSAWADQRLRDAILGGRLQPGDALVISTLAKELGVSATPLREALGRLAAEGLVELQAHGSARVATVDLREAAEIYELRQVLEPMALERSVAKADAGYADRVGAAWQALTRSRLSTASDHAAFHRELLSCCDSTWMLRLSTLLSDRAGLMMKVSALARPDDYNLAESHRRLKDLAVGGDAVGAAEELTRHLAGTIRALESILAGSA